MHISTLCQVKEVVCIFRVTSNIGHRCVCVRGNALFLFFIERERKREREQERAGCKMVAHWLMLPLDDVCV